MSTSDGLGQPEIDLSEERTIQAPRGRKARPPEQQVASEQVESETTTTTTTTKKKPPSTKTPLGLAAAVEGSMVDVFRDGPGEGPGWRGRLFEGQQVTYAWCGKLPNDEQLFDTASQRWGGGAYRFEGKDENGTAIKANRKFGGAPLPLTDDEAMMGVGMGVGMGRGIDLGGGIDMGRPVEGDGETMELPAGGGGGGVGTLAGTLNGFVFDHGRQSWMFFQDGQQIPIPRGLRPPPAPGFGGSFGGGSLIHPDDDRIARLEKVVEKLIEGGGVSRESSLDRFLQAQAEREARREEREEARRAEEREARREQIQAERDARAEERDRERERIAAEKEQRREERDAEREARREQLQAEREAREAAREREQALAADQSKNSVEMARIKAEADKEVAKANAEILKAGADASTKANERIIDVVMKKSDDVGLLERGMKLAIDAAGNKSNVAEVSQAARDLIPAVIDGVVAVKTMNAGQPGAPVNGSAGSPTEEDVTARMVHLVTVLFHKGTPPADVPKMIGAACFGAGFDASKLDPLIALGTPTTIGAYLEAQAGKQADEEGRKKLLDAKAALTSEQGKAWFQAVKAAFVAARRGSAGQIQGPGPSTPGAASGKN